MKLWMINVLFLISTPALAFQNCKLTVLTTSAYSAGVKWNILKYNDFTLDRCTDLCSDSKALENEVDAYDLVISCKMTYLNADGSETKAKFRFIKWPSRNY